MKLKEVKDNHGVAEETIHIDKEAIIKSFVESYTCPECDYPFSTVNEKNCHVQKHQIKAITVEFKQTCTIC